MLTVDNLNDMYETAELCYNASCVHLQKINRIFYLRKNEANFNIQVKIQFLFIFFLCYKHSLTSIILITFIIIKTSINLITSIIPLATSIIHITFILLLTCILHMTSNMLIISIILTTSIIFITSIYLSAPLN